MKKVSSIRRLDGQGRVILPAYIRKALNLAEDSTVTISMTEAGSVLITPTTKNCCICGEGVDGVPHAQEITVGAETRYICPSCFVRLREVQE
jgi:AbrB family looped-hinge helix DNA binding protein